MTQNDQNIKNLSNSRMKESMDLLHRQTCYKPVVEAPDITKHINASNGIENSRPEHV